MAIRLQIRSYINLDIFQHAAYVRITVKFRMSIYLLYVYAVIFKGLSYVYFVEGISLQFILLIMQVEHILPLRFEDLLVLFLGSLQQNPQNFHSTKITTYSI